MPRNPGSLPPEAAGKRIHARLFNGHDTRAKDPQGWAADGKNGCCWRISKPPHPYDIAEFEVI